MTKGPSTADGPFVTTKDFLAVFFAGAFLAVVFFAGAAFFAAGAAFFAGAAFLAGAAFFAAAVVFLAAALPAASVSLGSFLAPDTTFLRSAPAVNFGTAVFLALMRAPVCGLRTQRASRTRFSKEPKPVIATFSPLATSRVIVSRTDSRACCACLRFPSKRAASASTSCDLFTASLPLHVVVPGDLLDFHQRTVGSGS